LARVASIMSSPRVEIRHIFAFMVAFTFTPCQSRRLELEDYATINSTGCGSFASCCVADKAPSAIAGFRSPTCRCMPVSALTCSGRIDSKACGPQRDGDTRCRDNGEWKDIVDARWPEFRGKKTQLGLDMARFLANWNEPHWYVGHFQDTNGFDCFENGGGVSMYDGTTCWEQYQRACIAFDVMELDIRKLLAFCEQQQNKYGGPWQKQCDGIKAMLEAYTQGKFGLQPWRGIDYCFPTIPHDILLDECYAKRVVRSATSEEHLQHIGLDRIKSGLNVLKRNPISARVLDVDSFTELEVSA